MKCPVCNTELPSTAKFCGSCGTTLTMLPPPPASSYEPAPPPGPSYEPPPPMMNPVPSYSVGALPTVPKKYKVLRFIAVLIKILAFVAAAILIVAGLAMIVAGATAGSRGTSFGNTSVDVGPTAFLGGAVGGLILIVYGVFVFIFLYAYSEWMYVFMDIEENTRITNEMLSGRR